MKSSNLITLTSPVWSLLRFSAKDISQRTNFCALSIIFAPQTYLTFVFKSGRVLIPVSSITTTKASKTFPLLSKTGVQIANATVEIDTVLIISREKKKEKDSGAIASIFKHLKPILNNIFTILYVDLRPLLQYLLWIRRVVMDWERPLDALAYNVAFYIVWWNCWFVHFLIVAVFWHMTKRYLQRKILKQPFQVFAGAPKEMLETFKQSSRELKYGQFVSFLILGFFFNILTFISSSSPISEDLSDIFSLTKKILNFSIGSQFACPLNTFFSLSLQRWQQFSIGRTLSCPL